MLKKDFRLRKDKDVRRVLAKGKGFHGQFLGIKFLPNKLENNRFCLIISNKISKKSTKRNKIRRRLSEIVRLNLAKIKGNYDIVIIAKPKTEVLEKGYQELAEETLYLLNKIK